MNPTQMMSWDGPIHRQHNMKCLFGRKVYLLSSKLGKKFRKLRLKPLQIPVVHVERPIFLFCEELASASPASKGSVPALSLSIGILLMNL